MVIDRHGNKYAIIALFSQVWKWSNGDTRGTQNDQRSFRTDGAALLEEGQVSAIFLY